MVAKRRVKFFCGRLVYLMAALVLLTFVNTSVAVAEENVQHYKMISTVEYVGQGQFRNQVERLFTVRGKALSNNKVQYFISAKDLFKELSFVVDRDVQRLSQTTKSSALWAQVNNHCVKSLKKVTKANIGKTWKQSFDLSSVGKSLPAELKFTLTAIRVENQKLGEMIAVRALSEPFFVKVSEGTVTSRINTVYLFDSEIDDIFLSISTFVAMTDINGFKEMLRHKVGTYKTDAAGVPVDLRGLGEKLEKFVGKLGLSKDLKVVKASLLPEWVQTSGLQAVGVTNICSALACEGALNPVATISMPAAKVVEFQKSANNMLTANAQFANNVGGEDGWDWFDGFQPSNVGGKDGWDWFEGFWRRLWSSELNWEKAIVGAAIAIPIAVSDGDGGGGGAVSP